MSKISFITKNKNFYPLLGVLFFAFLAARDLFRGGYFNMHDDLQMMRQLEMEKCFLDGQIPCRWIPDMGYGFGFPLFNFYPPLPYLVGMIFRILSFSFVDSVKGLFILAFFLSGIAMYFLAKEFFGRAGAFISSVFYIWAPYHAVDIYVRGAMNEAWALIWFPLIFLSSYRLIVDKKRSRGWILGLALSYGGLLLSHNLMVLILTPFFGLWCLIWIAKNGMWKKIPSLLLSGVYALSLTAFFTLPAIFEQKYVQVDTLVRGYYEFIAHFVSLNQLLISRFWGYGPSIWEEADGMPFQVGHVHWILSLIILVLSGIRYRKSRKLDNFLLIVLFLAGSGWISLFMAHVRSTPIWQTIGVLSFVQFPWRFLTIVIFVFSFLAGAITRFGKRFYLLGLLLTLLLVGINWQYFKPEKMGPLTDKEKFTGAAWELQQTAGIYDYLPKDAKEAPKSPRESLAEVMEGKGTVLEEKAMTNSSSFITNIESSLAKVRVNIINFPVWRVSINGGMVNTYIDKEEKWGRIYIDVPEGRNEVKVSFVNTPIRKYTNVISLVAWLFTLYIITRGKLHYLRKER